MRAVVIPAVLACAATLVGPVRAQALFLEPLMQPCLTVGETAELPEALEAAGWQQQDPESAAGAEALASANQGFAALVGMAAAFETRADVAQFAANAARGAPPPIAVAGLYERRGAGLLVMTLDIGTGVELQCVLFGRDLAIVERTIRDEAPTPGLAAVFVTELRPGAGADPDVLSAVRIQAPGRSGRLLQGRDSLTLTRFIPMEASP